MSLSTLWRRRLLTHPMALAAVTATVVLAMLAVTTLHLLGTVIADSGAAASLTAADAADRTVAVSVNIADDELETVDTTVRAALAGLGDDVPVTMVAVGTTRGMPGGSATDRAQLAEIHGIEDFADLVDGAWPQPPTEAVRAGTATIPVALPVPAASELGWQIGTTAQLTDIIDEKAPPLTVELVGTYSPRDPADSLWLDDRLSRSGVEKTDFTTYGPFVVAPGTFAGPLGADTTATWRAAPDFSRVTIAGLSETRARVAGVVGTLTLLTAKGSGTRLRDGRMVTDLPELLERAETVGQRTSVALLTPTILLVLLGGAALAVAALLLASLREVDTRLLHARGASRRQVAGLALCDGLLVVTIGALGSALLGPLLARPLARTTELDASGLGLERVLTSGSLWWPVVVTAVLALAVIVAASMSRGRLHMVSQREARRRRIVATVFRSGIDVVLIALGVLGLWQLRRHQGSASAGVDLLTTAAPALVLAGVAVVCLRLIPLLARLASAVTTRSRGMPVAWGGWQLARRLVAQGGAILLILLVMAVGIVALGQSATTDRAVADQSDFETGAPMRVEPGGEFVRSTWLGPFYAAAAGGAERVMPVRRITLDVGSLKGVTMLAVDATRAGAIMTPRADLVTTGTWTGLMATLCDARATIPGVELPGEPTTLALRAKWHVGGMDLVGSGLDGMAVTAVVEDARGLWSTVTLGTLDGRNNVARDLSGSLADEEGSPAHPLTLIAVMSDWPWSGSNDLPLELIVDDVTVNGEPVPGIEALTSSFLEDEFMFVRTAELPVALPVVLTQRLATDAQVGVGDTFTTSVEGQQVPMRVTGIMTAVPTAKIPDLAMVVDHATLQTMRAQLAESRHDAMTALVPNEWWLDPVDPAATRAELAANPRLAVTVDDRAAVVAARVDNPVNAGLRVAMFFVTLAALALAGIGFAATTASLGRDRRHDGAILLALGMRPARLRRVLFAERVVVVLLCVAVGVVVGVAAANVIVPLLVAGDGHVQVPSVAVSVPWRSIALLTAALTAVLVATSALVLARSNRDLAATLRAGDDA